MRISKSKGNWILVMKFIKKHKRECRFGFPKAPMPKTKILHPSDVHQLRYSESEKDRHIYRKVSGDWNDIYDTLENWDEKNVSVNFEEFLTKLELV